MKAAARQRWAISFADLCLLLLGFSLVLQARPNGARLAAGMRGALGAASSKAAAARDLFEPGEAILNARGLALAIAFAHAAQGRAVTLTSHGIDPATRRLDGWELAAARAAALARALTAAGVPERSIALTVEAAEAPGQRLDLTAG